jgi:hypothetical protein
LFKNINNNNNNDNNTFIEEKKTGFKGKSCFFVKKQRPENSFEFQKPRSQKKMSVNGGNGV